ncbi:hypothetical protein DSCOOX_18240 [Desulfosarcina ovata subsp. ovata]|uniref:histidine kinase n=2 Tax=Desulfosarcina ovata TaxID=83564 RepID=A0A5K8A8H6_9BACT|nr:hypothetical protein DSCOOX_18240 [Desulfosarcina ovata subsp. ovata]
MKETLNRKLNWLMSLRFLFSLMLMGSTVTYQLANRLSLTAMPIVLLYGVSGVILLLSAIYAIVSPVLQYHQRHFACVQIGLDAFCITLIIFVTGGSDSVFIFLYLLIVIYSSVFVFNRGTFFIAGFCNVLFAVLLILEFKGTINPFGPGAGLGNVTITGLQVIQKCIVMVAACFSVAFLSGYLSDQERRSKAELVAMEAHLNRVQNLAQIGEMAAGLAHEIKNPLASLSGAIQILKNELEADKDNMRLMQIVLRETDRLSSLVNNFLTFARPSAGNTRTVNLGQALGEIVTLFEKNNSVDQRIALELNIVSEASIEIDPLQLHQIIWNLLLNAAESIEERSGRIVVTVQKMKNERILVEIVDNGCGMDEKTLQSIFNPFYTTKPNGTGLGLSIVYRILETYDCRVDVKSKPGVGSMFSLYFKSAWHKT